MVVTPAVVPNLNAQPVKMLRYVLDDAFGPFNQNRGIILIKVLFQPQFQKRFWFFHPITVKMKKLGWCAVAVHDGKRRTVNRFIYVKRTSHVLHQRRFASAQRSLQRQFSSWSQLHPELLRQFRQLRCSTSFKICRCIQRLGAFLTRKTRGCISFRRSIALRAMECSASF